MLFNNHRVLAVSFLTVWVFFISGTAMAQNNDSRVWNVNIKGNSTFEDIVIKKVISNEAPSVLNKMLFWRKTGMRFNETEVRRDVIRIERFYQQRGFNEVIVKYRVEDGKKSWRKNITFEVVENTPICVGEVTHSTQASDKDSVLIQSSENYRQIINRLPYKAGSRYEPVLNDEAEGRITDALNNLGYAYAESEIQARVDSTQKRAQVEIISNPGPRTRFDSILVEGENKLHEKYIIRETGIEKGTFYNEDVLRQAQREVFNHNLLRFALISIPEQPKDTSLNVLIRVRERPARAVEVLFGIGNLTRIQGWEDFYKLFRGQAGWIHRNMRGRGERLSITAHASAIEQRLSSQYEFPYLFNTKSSISLSPFLQHKLEPSYEIMRWGIINSFAYQYSQNFTGTVSYEFSVNDEMTADYDVILADSILSYNVSSFQINGYYTRGFWEGRRGWMLRPAWELSGLFGETTFSFQKAGVDVRKFTPLTDAIVLAKRVYFNGIYFAKQDSLPSNIRIYNGGTNAVRGWNRLELGPKRAILNDDGSFSEYVPIGGRATFNFNVELRIELNSLIKGFGVATFLDGGQVWTSFNSIGQSGLQYGLGGGLRYQSPIGPLRIDLAYKLNPTSEDLNIYQGTNYGSVWNKWGIHFSIGQAF